MSMAVFQLADLLEEKEQERSLSGLALEAFNPGKGLDVCMKQNRFWMLHLYRRGDGLCILTSLGDMTANQRIPTVSFPPVLCT